MFGRRLRSERSGAITEGVAEAAEEARRARRRPRKHRLDLTAPAMHHRGAAAESAMTVRNLNHLCKPGSVVLIGASDDPRSVGGVLARNLRDGGFAGRIMLVNPSHAEIEGEPCHPDVASLPATPDLAVVATPPATLPGIIATLGARGTKAAVVITAGLGEGGEGQGGVLRQAMLDAARPHLLRIVGPNCFGVLVPEQGLNATLRAGLAPSPAGSRSSPSPAR